MKLWCPPSRFFDSTISPPSENSCMCLGHLSSPIHSLFHLCMCISHPNLFLVIFGHFHPCLLCFQNELLPASDRVVDQTRKKPSGPYDRKRLLAHLEEQAANSTVGNDYIPFVKKKAPPKETKVHELLIHSRCGYMLKLVLFLWSFNNLWDTLVTTPTIRSSHT